MNVKAIFQGGESVSGEKMVSDLLFNSRVNYDDAFEKMYVMQGSCNVTALGRILQPLKEKFGSNIVRFDATLLRRWADLEDAKIEVKDTVEWTPKPHHGDDVKSYMGKDTPLYIRVFKVPSRQMHVHLMDIRFKNTAPRPSEILDVFRNDSKN